MRVEIINKRRVCLDFIYCFIYVGNVKEQTLWMVIVLLGICDKLVLAFYMFLFYYCLMKCSTRYLKSRDNY